MGGGRVMKKYPIYYTVITGKRSHLVKYALHPAYEVQLFKGAFGDPGEASQEFKIAIEGEHEYLTENAFDHKVERLSARYKQDIERLADWNSGRGIRV
jgi:hypothetical protein